MNDHPGRHCRLASRAATGRESRPRTLPEARGSVLENRAPRLLRRRPRTCESDSNRCTQVTGGPGQWWRRRAPRAPRPGIRPSRGFPQTRVLNRVEIVIGEVDRPRHGRHVDERNHRNQDGIQRHPERGTTARLAAALYNPTAKTSIVSRRSRKQSQAITKPSRPDNPARRTSERELS